MFSFDLFTIIILVLIASILLLYHHVHHLIVAKLGRSTDNDVIVACPCRQIHQQQGEEHGEGQHVQLAYRDSNVNEHPNKNYSKELQQVVTTAQTNQKQQGPLIIAVIFGWGGATLSQLRRLREWYVLSNIPVICYIGSMLEYFQATPQKENIIQILQNIDQLVKQHSVQRKTNKSANVRLFIHVHSNNGAGALSQMMTILHDSTSPYAHYLHSIAGITFDSSPFLRTNLPNHWWKEAIHLPLSAIGSTFPTIPIVFHTRSIVHPIWTPIFAFYFFYRSVWDWLRTGIRPSNKFQQFRASMSVLPNTIPNLFLYSTADKLISPQGVERFMSFQRARGVSVSSHRWSDSAHVNHFRVHPDEYAVHVSNFIRENVQKQQS